MLRMQGRTVPARQHRRATLFGALVALAFVAAGCGGSKYHYVANSQNGNFFKVPTGWNFKNVTEEDKAGRPDEIPSGIVSIWHTQFDNAPAFDQPTLDVLQLPEQVVGHAQIYTISRSDREQLSMSAVRSMAFGFGVDPLAPPDELSPRVRPVSFVGLTGGEGTGSRVIANFNLAEDNTEPRWMTVDVSFLLDIRTNRIFTLRMACGSSCYLAHNAAIDEIATSWTVKS